MLKNNFVISGELHRYNYTDIITFVNQMQDFSVWALGKG